MGENSSAQNVARSFFHKSGLVHRPCSRMVDFASVEALDRVAQSTSIFRRQRHDMCASALLDPQAISSCPLLQPWWLHARLRWTNLPSVVASFVWMISVRLRATSLHLPIGSFDQGSLSNDTNSPNDLEL